jgi:hypothetical protein
MFSYRNISVTNTYHEIEDDEFLSSKYIFSLLNHLN